MDGLTDTNSPARHVLLVAMERQLLLEAVTLRGSYREAITAQLNEPGELMVHARSAARVLALVPKELQANPARIYLREAADELAVEASLTLPTADGSLSDPLADIPHGSFNASKVWLVPSCALEPTQNDWDSAVRFKLSAAALRESLALLAPIKTAAGGGTINPPQVFLELADEDELILSSYTGAAMVVQRTPAALTGVLRQLRRQNLELPITLGFGMREWSSLSAIGSVLPKEGVVDAQLTFGVAGMPRTLQLQAESWQLEIDCLDRRSLKCPRESRELSAHPLLQRAYVPLYIENGGSFSDLLRSTLAFRPRGIALGVRRNDDGSAVLTVRGSSLDGMFDLQWPLTDHELLDEQAAATELVLPPRNLRSALDSMPEETDTRSLRIDFIGGLRGWMRHEAEAIAMSVGRPEATRTTITLAGKHR